MLGPEDLSNDEMAAVISEVLGTEVEYRQLTPEALKSGGFAAESVVYGCRMGARKPTWADFISTMGALRQELAEADRDGLHELTLPRPAATESQLGEAEERLGHPIDAQYREFLRHADGWPDFYLGAGLLSADELGAGDSWEHAAEILHHFYAALPDDHLLPPRHEISPIAIDPDSTSIFAVHRAAEPRDGGHPVHWLPADDDGLLAANFFGFFRHAYRSFQDVLEELRPQD